MRRASSVMGINNAKPGSLRHGLWTVHIETPPGTFIGTRISDSDGATVTVRISLSPTTSDVEVIAPKSASPEIALDALGIAMWLRKLIGLDEDDDGTANAA